MINLQLLFPKSSPAAAAQASGSFGTALNVQPAAGSAAPTAPSDPFPRTSLPGADLEAVRAGIRNIVETTFVDLSVARSIALGNALVLPIQGTAFMIDKGTDVGNALLHIQDQTNNPVNSINVFPGDTYTLPFTFMMIENAAQAGKVLRIHYGTGIAFQPSLAGTLTISGNVAITQTLAGAPQGADQASFNGKRFYGSIDAAGGAAQFTYIILSNPVGSGITVYVDRVKAYSFAANLPVMFVSGAAVAGGNAGFNHVVGGAASVARVNTVLNATDAGAGFGGTTQSADSVLTASSVSLDIPQPGPIVIPAGKAIAIRPQQANNGLSGLYVWREF